jgi:hypothetical protein
MNGRLDERARLGPALPRLKGKGWMTGRPGERARSSTCSIAWWGMEGDGGGGGGGALEVHETQLWSAQSCYILTNVREKNVPVCEL